MPTNLPPEARAKWAEVVAARTPEEKLKALEEFLSLIPKHKGTEKLRVNVKKRIVKLREEIEKKRLMRQRRKGEKTLVAKEGDVQVALIGFPNTGKTLLLNTLTSIKADSSIAPFETKKPQPAMLFHKGLMIQLVDTPSLIEGGEGFNPTTLTVARNADVLFIFVSARDPLTQYEKILSLLDGYRIRVGSKPALARIKRRASGGIKVKGEPINISKTALEKTLREYGVYHAEIYLKGDLTPDDIEKSIGGELVKKPALMIFFDLLAEDKKYSEEELRKIENICSRNTIPVIEFSKITENPEGFKDLLADFLLKKLNLIRVYTRKRGSKEIASRPLVIERGATVIEVAKNIHSRLYENFKYARVWSKRLPHSPVRVGKNFILEDGDVVEIVAD